MGAAVNIAQIQDGVPEQRSDSGTTSCESDFLWYYNLNL